MPQNTDAPSAGATATASAALRERLNDAYAEIRNAGFPIFPPGGERSATPLNCYPFHVSWTNLRADWAFTKRRAELVESLGTFRRLITDRGINSPGLLIGGSFADRGVEAPRDVDAVTYYAGELPGEADVLSTLQRQAKRELSIDTRFIPVDTDPMLLIRATAFFSLLYSKKEGSSQITRPLVFLDMQ